MNISIDYSYKCFNDCYQTGCPEHNMKLVYNTTSDMISLTTIGHKDGNGEWVNDKSEVFDRNELTALANAWNELKHK